MPEFPMDQAQSAPFFESLDIKITDKYIGKIGTPKRDAFENELRLELLGQAIRKARKESP